jgi:hypothetical protein
LCDLQGVEISEQLKKMAGFEAGHLLLLFLGFSG